MKMACIFKKIIFNIENRLHVVILTVIVGAFMGAEGKNMQKHL